MDYLEYLQTNHWRQTKEKALSYYSYQCTVCGGKKNLNVHHKRYKDASGETVWFREKLEDLSVLCAEHHGQFHNTLEEIDMLLNQEILTEEDKEKQKQFIQNILANIGKYLARQDWFINYLRKLRGAKLKEVYNG